MESGTKNPLFNKSKYICCPAVNVCPFTGFAETFICCVPSGSVGNPSL